MKAPLLFGAVLALGACADVAGPTRTDAPADLPGTLLIVRNWSSEYVGYGEFETPALPEGQPGLFRAERDGQFRPMFENAGVNEFADVALSPDGRRLAWIPRAPRTTQGSRVVTLDLTTGERRTITPVSAPAARNEPFDASPIWAPDGERLAMIRVSRDDRGWFTGRSLIVTDAAGTILATPLPDAGIIEGPSWHPDGRSLTVSRVRDEILPGGRVISRRELLRVGLDGTVALLISGNAPYRAVWSPDGQRFAANDREGFALRAPDGSLLQRVATGFEAYDFAWSPDGRFLAYCGRTLPEYVPAVWVWDSKQRTHRRLSPAGVNDCRPMWGR